jgi:type II secretory pathway component PulF
MPAFAYHAVDSAGKRTKGKAEAANSSALSRTLEERGYIVVEVRPTASAEPVGGIFRTGDRREVLEVTRALAALLPAGMPLTQALDAACQVTSGDVQRALAVVRSRVERGDMLADALAEQSRFFPPIYVGMVRAGERSGDLDGAFTRLAQQLEREAALRGRLLSASIYPLLLAFVGSAAITVLLMFVLPRFVELLQGSGASLPRTTELLLNFSQLLRRFWYLLVLVPVAGFGLGYYVRTSERGMRAWCSLLLLIPVVNTMRRYALSARFARVTAVLLTGGAPLLSALDDAIDSLNDPVAKDDVTRIRTKVREGSTLKAAVAEGTLFPSLLSQLIAVGEDSGRLRDFLSKAADIFEDKTERATQRLVTLAEPAMIVTFGSVVAFVALSLLQAIYGVNASSFK